MTFHFYPPRNLLRKGTSKIPLLRKVWVCLFFCLTKKFDIPKNAYLFPKH